MKVNLYHYLQGKSSFYERFFQQIKIRREYQSMNADKIKRMLDACYLAKRIRELLPELLEGVTPAYIQYMDVIHIIKEQQEHVKISDISDYLKLPRPGVTRTVKEMGTNMLQRRTAGSLIFRSQRKVNCCQINMIRIITVV